ncbi:MAG: armadillo-type protein [Monoraphidium minutum]|nr:MAG: armadillo-type protein [Monoraphidium minutum]
MLDFSLDQHGSRFIQLKLDTLSPEDLAAAFRELAPKAMVLMNDVFGNYVIQKILELGPDDHREELAQQMKGQVLHLSLQMYSCRVVQRALEVLPLERRIALARELQDHAMRCVRDQNGNHVVQKCIECVPSEHITTMLDTFTGQIVSLSMHSFGCRVVQRILEHCGGTPRYDSVMGEVQTAIVQLAQDQYGNYVIQHILEFGRPHERDRVINALAPHIVTLSRNKFASNVVEKCLLHGKPEQREALVEAILAQPAGGGGEGGGGGVVDSPLHQMMRDQFGNYVVQKLLEVCNEDQRERLLEQLRVQLPYLKRLTYGKHIVARVEKLLCSGARISTGALAAAAAAAASASVAPAAAPQAACDAADARGGGDAGCGGGVMDELAAGVSGLDVGHSLNTEALVAAAAAANTADERQWSE